MAHIEKYNKGAMGHMLQHYDRSKGSSKSSIDHDRTYLNYNLATDLQSLPQLEFIHKRLGEVKVQNRKDINVFCDCVLTAPKDLAESEHKKFFSESFEFLKSRYGAENVISAYVHMDETTPHMHFAFMPVVEDKKKGGFKLSAKEKITRNDLKTLHNDLETHLEKTMGYRVNVLNEATRNGNKSIEDLKKDTAIKKAKEITSKLFVVNSDLKLAQAQLDSANLKIKEQEKELDKFKALKTNLEAEIDSVKNQLEKYNNKLDTVRERYEALTQGSHIEAKESKLFKSYTITPESLEKANIAIGFYDKYHKSVETAELILRDKRKILNEAEKIKEAAQTESKQIIHSAKVRSKDIVNSAIEQKSLEERIKEAERESKIELLENKLERIKTVFRKYPDIRQAYEVALDDMTKEQTKERGRSR